LFKVLVDTDSSYSSLPNHFLKSAQSKVKGAGSRNTNFAMSSDSIDSASDSTTAFEVYVSKDTFKFNAAHFVAFEGYRERLHGHNYRVGVRLLGRKKIGADGYLIDFGNVKKVAQQVCKRLNEHFLCPIYSNVLKISTVTDDANGDKGGQQSSVHIECTVDGSKFVFPATDCVMLPIVHATAEEMAIYLYAEILNGLHADYLLRRGIHTMEVTVAEAVGQEAVFRLAIPTEVTSGETSETANEPSFRLDVRHFITSGKVIPMPCLSDSNDTAGQLKSGAVTVSSFPTGAATCDGTGKNSACSCAAHWKEKLASLARAINDGSLQRDCEHVTADTLQMVLDDGI
jgi:dihydroneopterin triphosphate aldolase (PTPS-III) / 6-pyruvoyltetrahydropterin synthase